MIRLRELKINGQTDPVGIGSLEEISWKIEADTRNVRQKAYEIQIAADEDFTMLIYDSGPVQSGRSAHIRAGEELPGDLPVRSACRYYVRARITTGQNEQSGWKKGCFVTAFLNNAEWKGKFITPEKESDKDKSRGYYLRSRITISKKIKEAFAFTTALGLYHFYVNGEKAGEDEFTPGWTSYHSHLLYQCYEITDMLRQGENMMGAMLGAGWYKGDMGSARTRNHYGKQNAFSCHIVVRYEDGGSDMYLSDLSWEWTHSPILFSEIYDGEIYDARLEIPGWNEPGAVREMPSDQRGVRLQDDVRTTRRGAAGWREDERWRAVDEVSFPCGALTAQSGCRVKIKERIPAKSLRRTPGGDLIVDFGQNMAGWIEFAVHGRAGDKAELNCFEELDKDGNVYFDNLRTAKATVTYICGDKSARYHPNFTYQGFRYAKISSFPGEAKAEDFTACALWSDMEETGRFTCSDRDIERLHHNIVWSMRSNFLDVPTDCPQRDERLGWTGDAQIFCRTAAYLMDTDLFYRKWLRDVAAEQTADGGVPHVVPDVWTGKNVKGKIFEQGTHSAAGWGDASVIIPWTLYLMYGDLQVLKLQYESMRAWIDFMTAHAKNCVWEYRMQFGDWVALDAQEGSYYGATPLALTNMAYYAYSTGIFARAAEATGNADDAVRYGALYEEIKKAYRRDYFTKDGRLTVQTQTAQILTLCFDLAPEEYRRNVAEDLVRLLKKENMHLVTGFMGTPHLLQALSDNGYIKEAYELLEKEDFPSWLYQVKQGATTVWEHWDGKRPDGSMWSPAMNSFNHYAYGAVAAWLYRCAAGIECTDRPEETGFKRTVLAPQTGGGLRWAGASFESVYGKIVSEWEITENEVRYHFEIPCNTAAEIRLYEAAEVTASDGLFFAQERRGERSALTARAGSGSYTVQYRIRLDI